ncbi:acyltransferase [Cronobacter sakazakii]|uniref:acyltransferase family protein n=1 Tax=Cronobacter sakazakii TaxID=28141 RepID=UPI000CF0E7D3|nr:acyltransferase [Cronobacter sakazakii]EIX1503255.1 acyltransferase [Cronobacter sakazakii]EIX1524204.1 acyltransferase [Cronobacter sakazakii]EIX1623437.1 acyltransferase [Cronobacter sakazakii]EIX1664037.1 acyltransferase [Cronobacter sakazakii]EIX1673325.1 acyltransferase [Cronobacter sakazakii]
MSSMNKISSVEGIRGLACLMVLISHLTLIFFPYLHGQQDHLIKTHLDKVIFQLPFGFLYSGSTAVYIFFALSGFILTYACANKGNELINAGKMFSARFFRLAIPASISIVLSALVLKLLPNNANGLDWISGWGNSLDLSFSAILYNAFFSSILLGDATYNWVVWTMKIELYGSFLIFFSVPVINQLRFRPLIYVIMALLFCCNLPEKHGFGYAAFFLGASIYYTPPIKSKILISFLLLLGLYLTGYHYKQDIYSFLSHIETHEMRSMGVDGSFFYSMIGGCLIVLVGIKSNILSKLTDNIISVWLGKVSFSAYLVQMPIFYLITPFSFRLREIGLGYISSSVFTSALCLIAIYGVAIFYQKYIDSMSIKFSRNWTTIFGSRAISFSEISLKK